MKKAVVITALGGLALAGLSLALQSNNSALSAELDGFSINTQDKAVTITLFTNQQVSYTTEHQGKQYTIVLPNTQLSETQINNGLPVVIDNKNRFIGRAVPTEDGKVKIILPNLPVNDYAVSVQQKAHSEQATVSVEPAPVVKPRPAISQPTTSNRFEKVAASFPKPAAIPSHHVSTSTADGQADAPAHISLKLSPSPNRATSGGGAIWNPYVVKVPTVPAASSSAYSHYQPIMGTSRKMPLAAPPADPPMNTISVAESLRATTHENAAPAQDPLWYLHALPPANPTPLPADSLSGPAMQSKPEQAASTKTSDHSVLPSHSISISVRDMIASIPKWLLMTLAVFLGGIGVFTLIGGLVLLRILFSQTRQQFFPQSMVAYPAGVPVYGAMPDPTAIDVNANKAAYASKPAVPSVVFQDKASFNALDYMKESPGNVRQAVHNTVLVKFPSRKRPRGSTKRPASRQVGNAPVYSYNP
jgi:hypothetical protein